MASYGTRTGIKERAPFVAQTRTNPAARFQPVEDILAERQLFDRIAEAA
jgi:hypothetical protein